MSYASVSDSCASEVEVASRASMRPQHKRKVVGKTQWRSSASIRTLSYLTSAINGVKPRRRAWAASDCTSREPIPRPCQQASTASAISATSGAVIPLADGRAAFETKREGGVPGKVALAVTD